MPSSDLIFIVGRQRSGTTVLRELFSEHGAFDCDEIMHGDLSGPHRFYSFVQTEIATDARAVYPGTHPALFRRFIDGLRDKAKGRKLAVDVKYFGLTLIPSLEDVDARTPFIVRFMEESHANVVHVVRRNKLRILVSEAIAEATGKWSAQHPDQLIARKPQVEIDASRVGLAIERMLSIEKNVDRMLNALSRFQRLIYEEMFASSGLFAPRTVLIAADFMDFNIDIKAVTATPRNLRMNPEPLDELVSNFDAVAQALAETPYVWMLDD